MLKWILYGLLASVLYRTFRGWFRRPPTRPPEDPPARRLDPERAVRASWSEVADDEGEGSGER